MIDPTLLIEAEVYLHAARAAVWEKFIGIGEWPRWQLNLLAARWVKDASWQEGAHFALERQGWWGRHSEQAVIRMAVAGDTTVWESSGVGLHTVHSAHLSDDLGGCKLRWRQTIHGPLVVARYWGQGRARSGLASALGEFKAYVERK